MKRMVKGVEVLFHLAYMVREGVTDQALLQNTVARAFPALDSMVDYLAGQKEAKRVNASPNVCSGKGCCNHLQCCKGNGGTPA